MILVQNSNTKKNYRSECELFQCNMKMVTNLACYAKKGKNLTCVYSIVLEILDVIVSKEVFTNLEKIEGKTITTKKVSSGVRLG